ncbi:hypothetical protein GW7_07482 [Heterocephalus glaber]|uniref:O(6)-methylguanine-induced apoptosis 2 n=1 Tax=Heterocephalus glaber TaxID=10181 RepID=G5BHX2_HETGA|nr:hypothetical protein GW7_07482 [Heterocephalus glaber]
MHLHGHISVDNDVPGPGSYNIIHWSPVFSSVSLSRKGTCTFPSMSARLDTIISKYPAANAYTIPSNFASKKDFSNSCSSMFQLPICVKVLKSETPAPNHYNASTSCCQQQNNVSGRAGFMSETQRGLFTAAAVGPALGHYDVNESLVKQSPKILMSCFKSKTDRGLKLPTGRGPGYYNPDDHTKVSKKSVIPITSLRQLAATFAVAVPVHPVDRVGHGMQLLLLKLSAQIWKLPQGPGQYETVNYAGPTKHFVSSSSFVSNTSWWIMVPSQPGLPGPATYKPEHPGKQSFLYNEDNKWVPVM